MKDPKALKVPRRQHDERVGRFPEVAVPSVHDREEVIESEGVRSRLRHR